MTLSTRFSKGLKSNYPQDRHSPIKMGIFETKSEFAGG